jgi:hypothetical protein
LARKDKYVKVGDGGKVDSETLAKISRESHSATAAAAAAGGLITFKFPSLSLFLPNKEISYFT